MVGERSGMGDIGGVGRFNCLAKRGGMGSGGVGEYVSTPSFPLNFLPVGCMAAMAADLAPSEALDALPVDKVRVLGVL